MACSTHLRAQRLWTVCHVCLSDVAATPSVILTAELISKRQPRYFPDRPVPEDGHVQELHSLSQDLRGHVSTAVVR